MTVTTWTIAQRFNAVNVLEFHKLASEERLAHITLCEPNGRLRPLTLTEADLEIEFGRNVYADVKESTEEVSYDRA